MDPRSLRERSDGQRSHICDPYLLDPVVTTDLITLPEIEEAMTNIQHDDPGGMAMRLTALGGILGAIAASSCCIAPLVLFSLGISGAWIGNLTALAPYQPYFIAATLACLGYGYWLVFRPSKVACAEGAACARPLPNRLVMFGLILATVLVAGALGFDLLAPLILKS
jgi:mercuric ion transport protein